MVSAYNENVWNDEKERMHERIKSLHDSGKGYRTIAKLLNAENLKTAKGKEWKNTNVYSVLKRYAERQARLERQSYTSEVAYFIGFDFEIFAIFKTRILLIAS